MARKKWRIERPMLVPAQWEGSVEHFYHFILGYFVPLVRWQEETGRADFAVRDCGPMNPWFELLRPSSEIDMLSPGVMLQRFMARRQNSVVLRDWDNPTRFHRQTLRSVRSVVTKRVSASHDRGQRPKISVLDRRAGPDFYENSASEVYSSGSAFRSVPNMDAVANALANLGDVALLDTAAMSPDEQVRALGDSDLLVGQHGAGLSNMIWMPPGASVLEILPPLPPTIDTIFRNLASATYLGYAWTPQEDLHSRVDPSVVHAAAEALLADPAGAIPTATGHSALRWYRQLPRRL